MMSEPIYLKKTFSSLKSESFEISVIFWSFNCSSSSLLWISDSLSNDILASCTSLIKFISWAIGELSCPTI
tara:strand:+ start:134 stop:346 length:213 start_codon:yes stop_codon:yes gene_type:complete